MTQVVKFAGANLPSVQSLTTALRSVQSEIGSSDGIILKMDKTGCWVFGADQTEVEEDSTWAINPFSFVHGYIAWGDGEVLGEKMVAITEPLPALDAAPPGAKKGWETQVGMSLKCVSGEDKDMDARYTVTSVGGKKAVSALAVAIATQVETDPTKPVPVVQLDTDHYQHKSYGKIYTPVFKIVGWVSMDGEKPEAEKPAEAPPAPETGRRRRRSAG